MGLVRGSCELGIVTHGGPPFFLTHEIDMQPLRHLHLLIVDGFSLLSGSAAGVLESVVNGCRYMLYFMVELIGAKEASEFRNCVLD
ncbi:hypothetical protein Dimus_025458 [Dionaea muscipula]